MIFMIFTDFETTDLTLDRSRYILAKLDKLKVALWK